MKCAAFGLLAIFVVGGAICGYGLPARASFVIAIGGVVSSFAIVLGTAILAGSRMPTSLYGVGVAIYPALSTLGIVVGAEPALVGIGMVALAAAIIAGIFNEGIDRLYQKAARDR